MLSLSIMFTIYSITISLMVMTVNTINAIKLLTVSLVLFALLVLATSCAYGIVLNNEVLLIKADASWRVKRYKIRLKDIQKTEAIEIKLGFMNDMLFIIYYKESDEEKIFRINQNQYFCKELVNLFKAMEKYDNILFVLH